MKNILIDFSPLKSGGGVQLALNFLNEIKDMKFENFNIHILYPPNPELNKLEVRNCFKLYSPRNIIKRIIYEHYKLQIYIKKNRITRIYTFFGSGLPHPSNTYSIVCVAYPIICYPESKFWDYINIKSKIIYRIKNYFRIKRIKKADLILVETEIMKERINKFLHIDKARIQILEPSPSKFLDIKKEIILDKKIFFIGLLSGLSLHKNLWRLPEIITEFDKIKQNINIKFVISVSRKEFEKRISNEKRILDYIEFVGNINSDDINSFYKKIDILMNLSDLESYSNNYLEAFKLNIPMILSDRDFSRYICGESAIYVEPHEPKKTAYQILRLLENTQGLKTLSQKSKLYSKKLIQDNERFNKILKYILGE